ncbi:hypothetical protein ACVCNH_22940 [Achromobacter anxifer]|uniref:Uncharacterized protein n=1 Tax=Alcaligenes xylosoxydans xylosoxydans TaxID=85698 RepID=A0A424W6G2_ALCXX|nr:MULTISPECIES: hypothetical protein [Achromobacter]RPJ88849.1 hypothetical protein DY367_25955 [Achromobacter xylosoxidans]
MFPNNVVYKGYRLTASVSRISVGGSQRPAFVATVALGAVSDQHELNEPQEVPLFASGGFVSSPVIAVDAAINHGRHLVDAHVRPF